MVGPDLEAVLNCGSELVSTQVRSVPRMRLWPISWRGSCEIRRKLRPNLSVFEFIHLRPPDYSSMKKLGPPPLNSAFRRQQCQCIRQNTNGPEEGTASHPPVPTSRPFPCPILPPWAYGLEPYLMTLSQSCSNPPMLLSVTGCLINLGSTLKGQAAQCAPASVASI